MNKTNTMKHFELNGLQFSDDGDTIIWHQEDGTEVDISEMVGAFDLCQAFTEAAYEAEEDDHGDDIYRESREDY